MWPHEEHRLGVCAPRAFGGLSVWPIRNLPHRFATASPSRGGIRMPMFLQVRQLRYCLNALVQNSICRRNFGVANQFNSANMHRDEDRQLWDLLGQANAPKVSPFFARNVIRRVRAESESARPRTSRLLWRILVPATAAALLALGAT